MAPTLGRRWRVGHEMLLDSHRSEVQDLEMPQRFMSCSSPYEAWSVHVGFLQKTITDYQKELTALAKLGRRQTADERRMKVFGAGTRYHPVFRPAEHRL